MANLHQHTGNETNAELIAEANALEELWGQNEAQAIELAQMLAARLADTESPSVRTFRFPDGMGRDGNIYSLVEGAKRVGSEHGEHELLPDPTGAADFVLGPGVRP